MSISFRVEQALLARLADPVFGINRQIAVLASGYNLDPDDIQFDFTAGSETVFVGMDSVDVEQDDLQYPCMTVDFSSAVNQNYTKGPTGIFSGDITAEIIVELPHDGQRLPRVSTTPVHLLEHAFFACFCSRQPGDIWSPGNGIVWAAQLRAQRRGWRSGGPNWLHTTVFTLPFELEAR